LLELAEDEDVKVRLWCLGQIGELQFYAKIDDDLILPLLKTLLANPHRESRDVTN